LRRGNIGICRIGGLTSIAESGGSKIVKKSGANGVPALAGPFVVSAQCEPPQAGDACDRCHDLKSAAEISCRYWSARASIAASARSCSLRGASFIADVAWSWDARPRRVSLCEISPGLFPGLLLGFVRLMSALIC